MTEPLLTARQLGDLLGLSTGTVLDRFEAGDLPGFRLYGGRIGAPVRFRWSEVETMLEAGRCGPRVEAAPRAAERVESAGLPIDRVEA